MSLFLLVGFRSAPRWIGIAAALLPSSWAQPNAGRLEFEVASVKPNKDDQGGSIVRTPGGLNATNAEFSKLVEMAFQTQVLDLSRVPDSLRSDRFDIVAKAAGKLRGDQYWEMLRALLEDRFKLRYHRQMKRAEVYTLIRKGAILGPKMNRSPEADCPDNPTGANFCGVSARPGWMVGQRVPMARIARELSAFADRPVQDNTGLAGSFDFQLSWTPDELVSEDGRGKLLNGSPIDTSAPNFFSAVQEQLGLKLSPKKGEIEVLVIDRAEPPSEN